MTDRNKMICTDCEWYQTINCPSEGMRGAGPCLPVRRLKACECSLERTVQERNALLKMIEHLENGYDTCVCPDCILGRELMREIEPKQISEDKIKAIKGRIETNPNRRQGKVR